MTNLIQSIGNSIRGVDSSRQLALGIAIGAWIGLLPKDNLILVGLLVVLIMSGANLVTGFAAAFVVSLFKSATAIYTDQLGELVVSFNFVVIPLAKFMQLPIAPWTRLDNSVVMGSTLVGFAMAVPLYVISFYLFEKFRVTVKQMLTDNRLSHWVSGAPQIEN